MLHHANVVATTKSGVCLVDFSVVAATTPMMCRFAPAACRLACGECGEGVASVVDVLIATAAARHTMAWPATAGNQTSLKFLFVVCP